MKKFVSWRRVSTKKQERSGLGLEAQKDIIDYFVEKENGQIIADFSEAYTGKHLEKCVELRRAIEFSKNNDAVLIIAKTDRFRNTIEALQIYDEMGEGHIYFCDLPHTDKFTLALFFAIAEREALQISIRTKAALKAKKKRIEENGGDYSKGGNWCTSLGGTSTGQSKGGKANGQRRIKEAMDDPINKIIAEEMKYSTDPELIAQKLNNIGFKTKTGLSFNRSRVSALCSKIKKRSEVELCA